MLIGLTIFDISVNKNVVYIGKKQKNVGIIISYNLIANM